MLLIGDCRETLRTLPDQSVHCVVTSPPYFGLRDYGGQELQIGREATPDEFVAAMVAVFREVRRVLRDDGTFWLNLGDSYATNPKGPGGDDKSTLGDKGRRQRLASLGGRCPPGFKKKDRLMIPARTAIALHADGWYLRDEIVWHKPRTTPAPVKDRTVAAHEMIYLFSKQPRYHFDYLAIEEPAAYAGLKRKADKVFRRLDGARVGERRGPDPEDRDIVVRDTRRKRSVWSVSPSPYKDAHFATYPPDLIEPCILAGVPSQCCSACGAPWEREIEVVAPDGRRVRTNGRYAFDEYGLPLSGDNRIDIGNRSSFNSNKGTLRRETIGWKPTCSCDAPSVGGTVLDPFFGAGTTGLVAERHGRNWIGCELNPAYAEIAERRIAAARPQPETPSRAALLAWALAA